MPSKINIFFNFSVQHKIAQSIFFNVELDELDRLILIQLLPQLALASSFEPNKLIITNKNTWHTFRQSHAFFELIATMFVN